jgi:uncharacterized protein YcsI (UPF0317 family)
MVLKGSASYFTMAVFFPLLIVSPAGAGALILYELGTPDLGTAGFLRVGKVPVRWGVELQYYVMQPDPVAPEWNLKIFFVPVMANPFK